MDWFRLQKKIAAGILGLTLLFNLPIAQAEESTQKNSAPENTQTASTSKPQKKIVINSASRILTLYEGDKKIAMYPLGLGKTSTPTPTGYYKILEKAVNPSWIDPSDPEYEVPSGPDNPLGYRWMQIQGNYGIHGTNKPDSIGYYVSNGCVRMYEKDVEELYDNVEVNTPVEITYNRVVVEKAPDDNVVYYIYPDGYGWQNITVADVMRWLEPYGVAPFASDVEIENEIQASDGEANYVGKPYNIELNGKFLPQVELNGRTFISRAVVRDTITYIPVVPIAVALQTKIEWRASESTLKTAYGEVTGYERKKQIYCNVDDAVLLFNIDGGLRNASNGGKVLSLHTVTPPPTVEVDTPPVTDKPKTDESIKREDTTKRDEKPIVDENVKQDDKNKPDEKPIVDENVKQDDKTQPDEKPKQDKDVERDEEIKTAENSVEVENGDEVDAPFQSRPAERRTSGNGKSKTVDLTNERK